MWFIYILKCEGGSLYTGIARDVEKRFAAHKKGKGGKYTRSHHPIEVVYTEKVETKGAALKREIEIKKWSRVDKVKFLSLFQP